MGDFTSHLSDAAARLCKKGLLHTSDSLSVRLPETGQFATLAYGIEPAISLQDLSAPSGDMHGQIYAARADVGAVFMGGLAWTSQLRRFNQTLPWVFDEQIRQLGPIAPRVHVTSAGQVPMKVLNTGANAFCLDDTALCLGTGLERLLLNIEILEKCAQSFVLATLAGRKVARIPWLVKFIAHRRLQRDQQDAAARHLRGERSVFKAGY